MAKDFFLQTLWNFAKYGHTAWLLTQLLIQTGPNCDFRNDLFTGLSVKTCAARQYKLTIICLWSRYTSTLSGDYEKPVKRGHTIILITFLSTPQRDQILEKVAQFFTNSRPSWFELKMFFTIPRRKSHQMFGLLLYKNKARSVKTRSVPKKCSPELN